MTRRTSPAIWMMAFIGCQTVAIERGVESTSEATATTTPVGLEPSLGLLAQLCAGARPVARTGLIRHTEPPLETADGGALRPPTTEVLLSEDVAVAALDGVLDEAGPFCRGAVPRRKSDCGARLTDVRPDRWRRGWVCLVRAGCGEHATDHELCAGFVDGVWVPRFLRSSPGGDLVGKRATAMKRRVDVARREAAAAAQKPPKPPRRKR